MSMIARILEPMPAFVPLCYSDKPSGKQARMYANSLISEHGKRSVEGTSNLLAATVMIFSESYQARVGGKRRYDSRDDLNAVGLCHYGEKAGCQQG